MRKQRWPGFLVLYLAGVACAAPVPEIERREAYDVFVRVAGTAAGAQWVWGWSTCAGGAAEEGGRSDIDSAKTATGRFLARDGRLDIEVELPGATGAQRYAAKAVAVPSDDALLARSGGAGEPARVAIRRAAPRVSLKLTDVPAREIAQRLARVAGVRIDGSERLSEEPITLNFQCIEPWPIVTILADVAGLTPLRGGRTHFGFSTAAERDELTALYQTWQGAAEGDDREAEAKALQPLLAKLDAANGELVVADTYLLGEAVRLANQRNQLAEGERALRAQLAQLERLNGDREGVDYGETLFRLGQQRHMQGDEVGAAASYDQAIATLERALGPVHPTLAVVLARRGAQHHLAGDHDAAIPLLQRAIASYGDVAADPLAALGALTTLELLGHSLQSSRRYDEARPVFARFVSLASEVDGEHSDTTARALDALADLEITTDRLAIAQSLLRRAAATAGASTRVQELAQVRLAAIELLGPFVDAAAEIDDARLQALRQRIVAAGQGGVADEALRMLDLRARRALQSEDARSQHRACQLSAEVEAGRTRSTDPQRRATIRDALLLSCMRRPMPPL
jgi:tetratricopeptide (TPR) repeat protein